ncbi:L,D-transpeptidase family protein [Aeromonas salmonicida]|uniref:L,D-transpeptidase family protein n=1 Tax=Aeromonas salmonicida TaxID=645 RepID=UPI00073BB469|nr:L,D-transpeptidase family protein [Aeromonas salmonicida]KTA80797.1 peptidoglycan-binding protein [Aeromonas salmonicida]MDE7528178.1 L,D-transpeptidase family protein [Aeromonas salmonicida]MDE7532528.1 L,D-transpeptidase family protein [Aeromonas salmonicida]
MFNARIVSLLLVAASLWTAPSWATTYPLPPAGSRLIGELEDYIVQPDEHLELIGKHTQIGFLALLEANPGVDPYLPKPGTRLTLPTQMLLPDVPWEGIVINLPELRLYYFPKGKNEVIVLPIGIGDIGRETPEMTTTVIAKNPDPTWVPGPMVRKSWLEQKGISLPAVVPPGPDNPLGKFAMRLGYGNRDYLIHGTNKEFGVGLRVSAGCIRLRPDDIEALFKLVPVGTTVRVINQPVKTATEPDGSHWLEVHSPLSRTEQELAHGAPLILSPEVEAFIAASEIDGDKVAAVLNNKNGIPRPVSG